MLQKLVQYLILIYEQQNKYIRLIITQLSVFSMKWVEFRLVAHLHTYYTILSYLIK